MATDVPRPLHCGKSMVPVVYGMPGPDLFEASERGDVVLGGCVVSDDIPAFRCRSCGATSGRIDDIDEHMADDEWG